MSVINDVFKKKKKEEEDKNKKVYTPISENLSAQNVSNEANKIATKTQSTNKVTTKNREQWYEPMQKPTNYVLQNFWTGTKRSLQDTTSALPQSYAVGLQRGANKSKQEQTTWDKIKNYGKSTIKGMTTFDPASRLLYYLTIGKNDIQSDFVEPYRNILETTYNNIVQQASQVENPNNINERWKMANKMVKQGGAVLSSAVLQQMNPIMQSMYNAGEQTGIYLGGNKAQNEIQKIQDFDDKIHKDTDKETQELAEESQKNGKVLNYIGEASQTIGYMTPSIALSLASSGASEGVQGGVQALGLVQMGLASKSSKTREGIKQGLDLETAETLGVGSGTKEALTEMMWSGLAQFNKLKSNGVEDSVKKYLGDKIEKGFKKGSFGKTTKSILEGGSNWLVDVVGESVEELVADVYDTWLEQAVTDPNKQYTLDDALHTVISTVLSTTFMNAGQKAIQNIYNRNQTRVEKQESIPEAEQEESNNYKTNVQSILDNTQLPIDYKQQLQQMLDSNATINKQEYNNLKEDIKKQVKSSTEIQAISYMNNVTEQVNQIEQQKEELNNIKPESFNNKDYRKLYAQLQNETELEDPTYDKILTLYPTNKNGNRPLSDWQNIARDYGKAMAEEGRSFDEVRHNVVKAWLDEKPYDRQQTSKNGQKLPTQRWYPIDQFTKTAYDSYRDTMKPLITEQQKSLQANMESQVKAFKDEYDTIIDTIDNLGAQETQVTRTPEEVERTKKLVEDFAKNRGVKVEYNADVFNNSNEEAFIKDNGKGDRTIYINPNADPDTILVKLATHEMFHDTIRTEPHDKLTKLVMDKLKADENYNTYRESVREAYQEQLEGKTQAEQDAIIDEEMTAKYLGEYLGDEQFVQQLVNSTNRTTVQRIMDWIDNRLQQIKNVVTGNTEAEYWRKVRENFEKAYNSKYQGKEGTQYSIQTDTKGRTLTKEQQEFFKDVPDILRDYDGNLRVYYRGSNEDFTVFDRKKASTMAGQGNGFYFTTSEEHAKQYGNVKEYYLNIKNPLIDTFRVQQEIDNGTYQKQISKEQLKKLVTEMSNNEDFDLENYGYNSTVDSIVDDLWQKTTDYGMLEDLNATTYGNMAKFVDYVNDTLGTNFDGIVTDYETVVLKPEQIKRTDNLNPTDNPDIRYSKKTAFDEALKQDNQGRTLTKEQQEYFKDSKVRDNEGRLLEVYHGTPTGGFNIYDNSKLGSATGAVDSSLGIHFTDNSDFAELFEDIVPENVQEDITREVYKKYGGDYDKIKGTARIFFEHNNPGLAEEIETKLKDYAKNLKGEVKKQYIDIKKPLSVFADYGISEQQLADDWLYITTGSNSIEDFNNQWGDDFESSLDFLSMLQQNFDDELGQAKDQLATPEAKKRLSELGYDGLILPLQSSDQTTLAELKTSGDKKYENLKLGGNEYIVFNSNQAKNVDNTNPTNNEDIRYNKKSTEYDEYLKANNPNRSGVTIGDLQQRLPTKQKATQPILPTQENNIANDYIKFRELTEQVKNGEITDEEFDRLSNIDDIEKQLANLGMSKEQVQQTIVDLGDLSEDVLNKRNIQDMIDLNKLDKGKQQEFRAKIQRRNFENLEKLGIPLTSDSYFEFSKEDYHNALKYSDTQAETKATQTEKVLPTKTEKVQMKTIEEPTLKVAPTKGTTGTEQKVAKVLSEPITKVKPEQRAWALFKANILDKGAVFEDLSFKSKNRELQAKWDSTLLAEAKGQNAIGQARYEFENGEEKQVSKALTDIIDEVGEDVNDFNNYMYHQLNIDRMTLEDRFDIANKPVFGDNVDANYSREQVKELEKAHPEFKEYAQDVYDYLDANKKELVDNGVISQETSDKFKEMYPHYVPIARIDAKGQAINVPLDTGRTGVNSPIKRAKGGSQDIQPLFQTMASRTMQTYKASSRNLFGLELKNTLDKLGMFNQLENTVENIDNENIFEYDADKGNLQEGTQYQNPTFTVFDNGEKVTYEINQDMYDALRPKNELLSKWDNTKLMKTTRKINDIRRGILTEYNPVFSITNAIKDSQDVLMNSQHATKTYAKYPEAYSQILKKGYWYKEYVQNGGSQNSYFTDGDFVKQDSKAKSIIKMPLEAISNVNNVIEIAPRLAEYIASREEGKSVQSAMLDASRVTTNFKAGGDITKFANRNGATFLNASVQGLQQNIRNIREANAKGLKGYGILMGKTIIASLPALILNNLVWKDDDDYEDLQDYVKDNYYIIAKVGDHKFLRIPKGRTVAVVQKAVTNISDFLTNKNEIDPDKYSETIWNDLKDTFELASNNLAPNNPIENNIISPIIQAFTNKTWYGTDLVPTRLQDKPNEEKYDESTAEISKQISGILNKIGINSNPMQINYLLDQYGGGVSDILLPLGTPQAENNVLEDKFTTDSVMKSRYPGEFFELKDKLAVNRNSSKATDKDELLYKYANSVSGELSDLYKQKREIQNSSSTDKEKKQQISEVQKQINSKTQQALKDIKTPSIDGDTATIGDSEFIRTLNANSGEYEWKKLTDKTKIQGVSLKTQADYQNRLNKYKQETGDLQLSDKEEIQVILDGNYTTQEKKNIYLSTTGKKDTLYNSVRNNLNIDEYLNYKTANIQGVKDSSGKTISGTYKQAQLDYINKNISGYENRLLLMGKDYKLSRTQQQDLAEYIYSQDNAEDLFKLFTKNFTVSNGTVYYK